MNIAPLPHGAVAAPANALTSFKLRSELLELTDIVRFPETILTAVQTYRGRDGQEKTRTLINVTLNGVNRWVDPVKMLGLYPVKVSLNVRQVYASRSSLTSRIAHMFDLYEVLDFLKGRICKVSDVVEETVTCSYNSDGCPVTRPVHVPVLVDITPKHA